MKKVRKSKFTITEEFVRACVPCALRRNGRPAGLSPVTPPLLVPRWMQPRARKPKKPKVFLNYAERLPSPARIRVSPAVFQHIQSIKRYVRVQGKKSEKESPDEELQRHDRRQIDCLLCSTPSHSAHRASLSC